MKETHMTKKFYEQHLRTFSKLISWRLVMIMTQTFAGYLTTGSATIGLQIAIILAVINTIIFWLHDRLWNISTWGRIKDTKKEFNEKYSRTIVKSITWRVLMIIVITSVAYVRTGNITTAILFMSTAAILAILAYWFHERIWNMIRWGKKSSYGVKV